MKLIDRYVGWQVFTTALFAVAILSVVLVLGNVFKQLLELLVNSDAPFELILIFRRVHPPVFAHLHDSMGFPHRSAAAYLARCPRRMNSSPCAPAA